MKELSQFASTKTRKFPQMQYSDTMPLQPAPASRTAKTLDIGFCGTSLSTDLVGTILQISTFHPEHGIVLAEPYEQFDGTRFRDASYVREYRTRMLESVQSGIPGFGLRLGLDATNPEITFEGLGRAKTSYQTTKGVQVTTWLQVDENGEVTQSCELVSFAESTINVKYTLDLGISVNRASYGQLTEGGPIPLPKSENRIDLRDSGCVITVVNRHLDAQLLGTLQSDFKAVDLNADVKAATFECRPAKASSSRLVEIPPGTSRTLTARFKLKPGTSPTSSFEKFRGLKTFPSIWPTPEDTGRYIVRRNLEYILGNCTVPLEPTTEAICVITDHVALPLGWMRDNFWQIRFLLDVYANIERLTDGHKSQHYSKLIKQTVKGHIKWIYQFAQRPHKFWHRSYLTTGRPKDGPVFQLDQQCYPLLELCDFFEACPEEREFVASILCHNVIPEILDLIKSKRDLSTGLFPTDETPGDDAVEYPFHFSSHVLLWYTITKLDKLVAEIGDIPHMDYNNLGTLADDVRAATLNHFLFHAPETKPAYAYLVNGTGLRTFYHDANDIPTLFASTWGFTRTIMEREAWRNTMSFAFTKANEGGFYGKGPFGGLGSVHTRGPWTLGYFQSWTFAYMVGDTREEEISWKKICGAMLWDGLFSEAVDGQTGECTSKAWFSWPGAMIGSGILHSLRIQ